MLVRSSVLSSIGRAWYGPCGGAQVQLLKPLHCNRSVQTGVVDCGEMIHSNISAASLDHNLEQLVRLIHDNPTKTAVYVTGGASQGVSMLLCVPGASKTVLEVLVPYSRGSLVELLGQEPSQYSSADTALALAKAAYQRAAALSSFGVPIVGLAATCALASEPPKRGQHRAYIAAYSSNGARLLSLVLAKGARSRWQEEQCVGQALLQVLARACDIDPSRIPQLPLLQPTQPAQATAAPEALPPSQQPDSATVPASHTGDELHEQFFSAPDPLQELLAGRVRCVEFSGGHVFVDAPRGAGRVYLPGSFNPLHEGHQALLKAAMEIAGKEQAGVEGCFEITVRNADKGQLSLEEVQHRVAQFVSAGLPVLVTTATLLVDKARLLPGSTFVLGWDTAVRIVMTKYYGDSEVAMQLVFRDIKNAGCQFLVAGRVDDKGDGKFKSLEEIQLPLGVAELFKSIPEGVFRSDLSSTALRAEGKGLSNRIVANSL